MVYAAVDWFIDRIYFEWMNDGSHSCKEVSGRNSAIVDGLYQASPHALLGLKCCIPDYLKSDREGLTNFKVWYFANFGVEREIKKCS